MSTPRAPTQPEKPDFSYRPSRFTLDFVKNSILDRTIFSPLALLALPALALWLERDGGGAGAGVDLPLPASLSQLRHALFTLHPWIGRVWTFVLLKHLNRALVRYVRNLGEWRADRPDWSREVVVVTGGAAGIGKATVELLCHRHHAKVAVLDMGQPTYAPAPKGAPEVLYFKTDVSDPEQVRAAAEKIRSTYGPPTILMNCAGIAQGSLIVDADLDVVQRVWRVNTLANFVTVREFLPHMVKVNHGHILTVASAASFMSLAHLSQYATSKAAAVSFHEVLQNELLTRYKAHKVRTTVCCPTKVRTALGDGMEDHETPFVAPNLMPSEVAERIVGAFESGLSQYIIMPEFMRILPWMRAVPDWIRRLIQILGKTDEQVTDASVARALRNGYGADWTGEAAEQRRRTVERVRAAGYQVE